jgi:MSHA biogenesis protein MshQ
MTSTPSRNGKWWSIYVVRALVIGMLLPHLAVAGVATFTTAGSQTWTPPSGVTSVTVEVWGGGAGGGGQNGNNDGGGGGGGGGYSKKNTLTVSSATTYNLNVGGAGGGGTSGNCGAVGGDSWFSNATTVLAKGGNGGCPSTGIGGAGGPGGLASSGIGDVKNSGGNGGTGRDNNTGIGGPGGSSAGTAANGTNGPAPYNETTDETAQAAPTGGGIGGNGGTGGNNGNAPASGNGGGGGGSGEGNRTGGSGAAGKVIITYADPVLSQANSTVTASSGSILAGGTTTSTITVTLKDSSNAALSGRTITLSAGSGSSIITTVSGTTNASGVATFTVLNGLVEGPITYSATDVITSTVLTSTAQVTFTLPPPTAIYTLDDQSWNDTSGNAYNGTVGGLSSTAPTFVSTSPALGNSTSGTCGYRNFVRSDKTYIALAGLPNLGASGEAFTITAWIRTTDNTQSGQRILIDDEGVAGGAAGYGFSLGDNATGQLRFFSRGTPSALILDTTNVIANNTWYFVAAVVNVPKKTKTIYVFNSGGTLATSASTVWTESSFGSDSGVASIGGETNASGENNGSFGFAGNIDEVRVYPAALPSAQLQSILAITRTCPANVVAPGSFNACEASPSCTPTALPNVSYAAIADKTVGTAFGLEGVALLSGGTLNSAFTGKTLQVDLVANTLAGVALDSSNCPLSQTATIALGNKTFTSGRAPISSITVNTPYTDVRVKYTCPTPTCATATTGCSTDNFSVKGTITLADGTNPGNVSLAPGASITDLDSFTLTTDSGNNNVTALTVTLTGTNSYQGLSEVRITDSTDATTYFSAVANPASNTVSFSGGTPIPVSTTPTTFKVRITPKTHANMPAPAGTTYPVAGTVTAFTSTFAQVGTDFSSATVTIDNLSSGNVTAASGTAGNAQVTLNWTNPADADLASIVVLRNTVAVTDTPVEGTAYSAGDSIGASTVACIATAPTATCNSTGLTGGTAYFFKIFSKDSNGNYSSGGTAVGPLTPLVAPTVTKSFSPSSVAPNATSVMTITLSNANATPINGAAFSDSYPSNLVNTTSAAGSTTCSGGIVTASNNGTSVALSGATIPANGNCTVTVNVTAGVVGSYANPTSAMPVTSTNASNGTLASSAATLVVQASVSVVSPTFSTVGISCTSADPSPNPDSDTCSAATGSATLTANNSRTATITVTLKQADNTTLVSGKTVTLTQSGGTSTITTLVGVTVGGIATFTVQNSTAEGPITYTAIGEGVTLGSTVSATFTPSLCFHDNFSGSGSPGANWTVGVTSGSFTPQIVGTALRLTNTTGNEATWISLNKYFPGSGNKVTIEFDHFAYGGSGADGMAVIISDASIAPAAGAFGGSLGYAPKSNPGSDCTVTGGCVGFAGGWMGVALDEYGNFPNPTEGRYLGPGAVVDSVSIRGSGSGMSGYRYIAGTATLSPGIDGNGSASPPYRYRIIVDHSDTLHAWVSVERDTSGGGTAYSTLIGASNCTTTPTANCLDIKDPGYSQNAVPANWRLSFTGSSGGSNNNHDFDSLKVCTAQSIVSPSLHHIQLEHTGLGCTGAGTPTTVTVKACADASCSVLYPGAVTASLSASPATGTTWTSSPVTFSGGTTTVSLASTSAATITLGGTATSPTTANATTCVGGPTGNTCNFSFSVCSFDAVEVGAAAFTPIYTKLANTPFNLSISNLTASTQAVSKVEIVDAGVGGTCSGFTPLVDSSTAVGALTGTPPRNFTGSQVRTFAFSYPNAVNNARIRIVSGAGTSCSNDNFAIRPLAFTLTAYNASDTLLAATQNSTATPILKAGGDTFKIKADSGFSNYAGINVKPKFNASKASQTLTTLGTIASVNFPDAVAGASTVSGFTYAEVGNFSLAAQAVYDDSFTAVDSTKAQPECTSDFSNTANANGKFGCMFGNTGTLNIGRFVPDHFKTTVTEGCVSGAFTYAGQPFTVKVDALNYAGGNTTNYSTTTGYAKVVTLDDRNATAGNFGTPTTASIAATSFLSGLGYYTSTTPTFNFTTTPSAPATLSIRASDSDTSSTLTPLTEGQVHLRSGRLRLANAFGAEQLPLSVRTLTEYWDGTRWLQNTADSCTSFNVPASGSGLALALAAGGTSSASMANGTASGTCTTTTCGGKGTFYLGDGRLLLSAPGAGKTGYVDITLTPPGWLLYSGMNQNTTARASFGLYNQTGNARKIIYRREVR